MSPWFVRTSHSPDGSRSCNASRRRSSQVRSVSAMRRSMRWAERCRKAFRDREGYLLFGIVQGGIYPHLREESAKALIGIGFDGYAIGGLAIGGDQLLDHAGDVHAGADAAVTQ